MVCTQCGARISDGAGRCDLCGTEVAGTTAISKTVSEARPPRPEKPVDRPSVSDAMLCPACGRSNRPNAIFCDQCATPLSRSRPHETDDDVPGIAPDAKADGSEKSRVGILIVSGIVVVAVLYGITVLSKSGPDQPPASATATTQAPPAGGQYLPVDDDLAGQAEAVRSAIEETTDPSREVALRTQLVELYASSGRLDLAGREQEIIASNQNAAPDWTLAGNLHFDWMEQQSGTERVNAARRAISSYVKALELEPGNLDVRTDLGVAYLNDPSSPMLAIRETNTVLEQDPDHIQANFNKGVMLLQIGRETEAVEHFEKVKSLTEPGTAAHERALSVLDQVRQTSG